MNSDSKKSSYWAKQRKEIISTLLIIGCLLIVFPWLDKQNQLENFIGYDMFVTFTLFGILFIIVGAGIWVRRKSLENNTQPRGIGKTSNIVIIIIAFVFAWGITEYPQFTNDTNIEESKSQNKVSSTEGSSSKSSLISEKGLEAIRIAQDYKGKDNSGSTVTEIIALLVQLSYLNEDIVNHPATSMGWDALQSMKHEVGIYDVYFDFKTYERSEEFHFLVNVNSEEVWSGNSLASEVLKLLDADSDSESKIAESSSLNPEVFCTENTKNLWSFLKLEDLYLEKAKEICN